jgi:hypothetical protein
MGLRSSNVLLVWNNVGVVDLISLSYEQISVLVGLIVVMMAIIL